MNLPSVYILKSKCKVCILCAGSTGTINRKWGSKGEI